ALDQPSCRRRPVRYRPEVPAKGAGAALRVGGAGGRPGTLAARRSDPGATGGGYGASVAVGATQSGGGGLGRSGGMLLVAGTVTACLLAGWALAEKGRATEAAGVAENEAIRAGAKDREALNEKERAEAQKKEADRLR